MVIILDWVLVLIKQSLHRGSCGRSFTTEAYFLFFFFFHLNQKDKQCVENLSNNLHVEVVTPTFLPRRCHVGSHLLAICADLFVILNRFYAFGMFILLCNDIVLSQTY